MSDLSNNFPTNTSNIPSNIPTDTNPVTPTSAGPVDPGLVNPADDASSTVPTAVAAMPNLQGIPADEVHIDGDIYSVPQETVGFDEMSASSTVLPVAPTPVIPPAQVVLETPEKVQTDDTDNGDIFEPESVNQLPSAPLDETPANVQPPVQSNDDLSDIFKDDTPLLDDNVAKSSDDPLADPGASKDEKSPLDILEEILAGAEAEKKEADDEQKQKDDEEAAFQAQLAQKTAEYQVQADVKLAESRQIVEEAKQQRVEIDQQLQDQGKIDAPVDNGGDEFAIRQLEHVRPE